MSGLQNCDGRRIALPPPERKVVMKTKTIRNLSVALLAAVSAFAQESLRMTVKIPFGFHVGDSNLESGPYSVETRAIDGMVRLRSNADHSGVMILTNGIGNPTGRN